MSRRATLASWHELVAAEAECSTCDGRLHELCVVTRGPNAGEVTLQPHGARIHAWTRGAK